MKTILCGYSSMQILVHMVVFMCFWGLGSSFSPIHGQTCLSCGKGHSHLHVTVEKSSTAEATTGEPERKKKHVSKAGPKFRNYMIALSKKIHNKRKCAQVMDYELSIMEQRWHTPGNVEGLGRYRGAPVDPDTSCYAMVMDAYAVSGMGTKGAHLASKVLDRFNSHWSPHEATTVLLTAMMKAWANADDFVEAKKWLRELEERFFETRDSRLEPDQFTYSEYLNALSRSERLSPEEIAEEAIKTLHHMDAMADEKGVHKAKPNAFNFAAAIKCVGRLGDYKAVEGILETLKRRYEEAAPEDKASLKPGVQVYGAALNAYSRGKQGIEAARAADGLLKDMQRSYEETSDPSFKPNGYIYSSILTSYSRVYSTEEALAAAERVEELLNEYENDSALQTSPHVYGAAIQVKANKFNPNGAVEAEKLLRGMPFLDQVAYQTTVAAYANRGQVHEMQRLFDEMLSHIANSQIPTVTPLTYATCINAWMKKVNEDTEAIKQADRLVRLLATHVVDIGNKAKRDAEADRFLDAVNSVLNGWRVSGREDAGVRAESLLSVMEETIEVCEIHDISRLQFSYLASIEAWKNTGNPTAGWEALQLLERLESPNLTRPLKATNSVLIAVLRTLGVNTEYSLVDEVNDILERICDNFLEGDTSSDLRTRISTSLLVGFVRSTDMTAAQRSEAFLRTIDRISKKEGLKHLRPSHIEYNCVVHRFMKEGSTEDADRLLDEMKAGDPIIHPDITTYSSVVASLIESGEKSSVDRGITLMKEVLAEGCNSTESKLAPDEIFFVSSLMALSKMKHEYDGVVDLAFGLFNTMREVVNTPPSVPVSVLSKVCLKRGTLQDMEKLQSTVIEIEKLADGGKEKPLNKTAYSNVLTAFMYNPIQESKKLAIELLARLEDRERAGKTGFKLNRSIYHIVLAGLARSGDENSFNTALTILNKLEQSTDAALLPSTRTYDWVILAAAKSKTSFPHEKNDHFGHATKLFSAIHKSERLQPTQYTYYGYLVVCSKLLAPGSLQDRTARTILQLCVHNRLVNEAFENELVKNFAPVLEDFLESEGHTSIPAEWRCNLERTRRNSDKE